MLARRFLVVFIHHVWTVLCQGTPRTVSVINEPGYPGLRQCGQRIFGNDAWLKGGSDGLQCPSPYLDSCFCRSDLKPLATSYISSVNYKYCSYGDADFTAEVNLYDSYCAKAVGNQGVVTSTFSSGTTPTVVVYVTPTQARSDSLTITSTASQWFAWSAWLLSSLFLVAN